MVCSQVFMTFSCIFTKHASRHEYIYTYSSESSNGRASLEGMLSSCSNWEVLIVGLHPIVVANFQWGRRSDRLCLILHSVRAIHYFSPYNNPQEIKEEQNRSMSSLINGCVEWWLQHPRRLTSLVPQQCKIDSRLVTFTTWNVAGNAYPRGCSSQNTQVCFWFCVIVRHVRLPAALNNNLYVLHPCSSKEQDEKNVHGGWPLATLHYIPHILH